MSERNFSGVFFKDGGFDYRRLAVETWEKTENETLLCFASVNSEIPFFVFPDSLPEMAFDPEYDRNLVDEKIGRDFLRDCITENSSPFFRGYVATRCSAFFVQWEMQACDWYFEGERAFRRLDADEAGKAMDQSRKLTWRELMEKLRIAEASAAGAESDGRKEAAVVLPEQMETWGGEWEAAPEAAAETGDQAGRGEPAGGLLRELKMSVKDNWSAIKNAMEVDPDFAWSVYCNVAVACMDEGLDHRAANAAAARVMRGLFEIDIQQTAQWKSFEAEWKKQEWQASEPPPADPAMPDEFAYDWESCPSWVKWQATDKWGTVLQSELEPAGIYDEGDWIFPGKGRYLLRQCARPATQTWKYSKRQRPSETKGA